MAQVTKVKAYGATSATSGLAQMTIPRRAPTDKDVKMEILYCGVCHSDIHMVRGEWMPPPYPVVPGHEIIGRVTAVGAAVSKFKVGDVVGVGCEVDSDRTCEQCHSGHEQYCPHQVQTYCGPDVHLGPGSFTFGGYSEMVVVDEHFVFAIPSNLSLPGCAPLLCAGITTFSPLRRWGDISGKRVGVVGLGGLGHMGIKFAHAMGAHVVLLSRSLRKKDDGLRLGADEVVATSDAQEMARRACSLDYILDTVSAEHDINALLALLKVGGDLTLVGASPKPLSVSAFTLIMGGRSLSGSAIGSPAVIEEMLQFCSKHGITSDVEVIPISKVNEAYERVLRADVKYRFCIDMASLKAEK